MVASASSGIFARVDWWDVSGCCLSQGHLPVAWVDGLACILSQADDVGVWPDGLLDAYIAMIPKTGGDATTIGQRPLSVSYLGFCLDGAT